MPPGGSDADVRGFSWVIAEAMSAGLRGAVALPYSIPAVTAAQFIADLYAALWAGQPLGAAVAGGPTAPAQRTGMPGKPRDQCKTGGCP